MARDFEYASVPPKCCLVTETRLPKTLDLANLPKNPSESGPKSCVLLAQNSLASLPTKICS